MIFTQQFLLYSILRKYFMAYYAYILWYTTPILEGILRLFFTKLIDAKTYQGAEGR